MPKSLPHRRASAHRKHRQGSRNAQFLIGARAARSVGQGLLAVDFALYLKTLRWPATEIGTLFMGGLLLSSLVAAFMGPLSDRLGRRRFLLGYEASQILAASLALASSHPVVIITATLLGGFGHGLNGGAGPFAPVELAWLSHSVPTRSRPRIYSINMAMGFSGMGLGALLAALPHFLKHFLSPAAAFRALFLFVIAGSVVCIVLIWRTIDGPQEQPETDESKKLNRTENRFLLRLMAINALNGIGIGLIGPLMAYWFAVRYGKGPYEIAPVMAAGLFLTALSSLLLQRIARRHGVVRSVVAMRVVGAVLLFIMPFAPTFSVATVLYVLRSAMNRGTAGARQAINMGIVRAHRRGLAASLNNISLQVPRAIGPVLTGILFSAGALAAPFVIGAGFQLLYVFFYQRMFRNYDRGPGEEEAAA
ncbi:MAG: MFS transporter [Acidiferrobacteraceae bacterium]